MKVLRIVGVLVFLLFIVGSASACSISLTKSASPSTYFYEGQIITYTYLVKNTGSEAIKYLKITDNRTTVTLEKTTLRGYETVKGTATYHISPEDLSAGYVTNSAQATGQYNAGTSRRPYWRSIKSNEVKVTVNCVHPALILEKSADSALYDAAGQKITYTYEVTNSGDVVISGPITVNDDKLGTLSISSSSLSPGQTVSGTATHITSQNDLDAGSITNIAYATGTYRGQEVTSNTDTVTVNKNTLPDTQIPEFPSIALPVASILGLIFISQYRKKEK
ncbi:DUF7507 domain-containing protein [Methanosarcina mazei]|uniref:DUF11 domain-containing protein n=1 Tax=Methanosarcina mazei SarPi TaxID=1434115 RepID=A0A0E3RBI3_METMZ|nr:PEF-CTERM sorting domain-containing protein [Methanosarcina mazei]AKB61300.1 hypothetical protein MSMAP_1315 [Methanosarcina mazei SarPi]